jgi:hypothetical protein
MKMIQFSGRVLPPSYEITLDPIPQVSCFFPDFNMRVGFRVAVRESIVTVDCYCPEFDPDVHFIPIYIRAIDVARAPIDVFAFGKGLGFFLIIDSMKNSDGTISPLPLMDPSLEALATAITRLSPEKFRELLGQVMLEPALYRLLRDLNRVLTETHVAPQCAFRAIEGIRHLISPNEANKIKSWERLRSLLRISRSYLSLVTDHSIAPRHGQTVHVPGRIQADLVQRAWSITNRYFEFRLRGGIEPLPESEFPTLA